jgi:hypothetical protein
MIVSGPAYTNLVNFEGQKFHGKQILPRLNTDESHETTLQLIHKYDNLPDSPITSVNRSDSLVVAERAKRALRCTSF